MYIKATADLFTKMANIISELWFTFYFHMSQHVMMTDGKTTLEAVDLTITKLSPNRFSQNVVCVLMCQAQFGLV